MPPAIQLGLLPAAHLNLLKYDVSVNAITGSTGAGQKPGATTHFSWRNNNLSIYKPFQHQHMAEIRQSLAQVQGHLDVDIDFIPYRGDFARGIFCTEVIRTKAPADEVIQAYKDFYADAAFTHYSDKPIDLKQVVNTNKCLVHIDAFDGKLLVTSCHRQPAEGSRRSGRAEHEPHVRHRRGGRTQAESLSILNNTTRKSPATMLGFIFESKHNLPVQNEVIVQPHLYNM